VEVNDIAFLPFLRYYPTQPASSGGTLVCVAQRGKPLIEQLHRDFLRNVPFESESDKPRSGLVSIHRPADEPRPALALTVRKVTMTRRELLALRSPPRWIRFPLRAISNVEPNITLVEGKATPVAIDSAELFSQAPLDGIRAERYCR